jgi:hypothetical protein
MRPVGRGAVAVEDISAPPSVSAYCRQARRLRGTLAHQPARMHRKLRELSVRPGAPGGTDAASVARASQPESSAARAFANRVAAGMDGPVLRYSNRRTLIREAGRAGIGAFEANLLIAAVQHERRGAGASAPVPRDSSPAPRLARLGPLLLIIMVEAAVAVGAWHVFAA